jgi:hypothetical protein
MVRAGTTTGQGSFNRHPEEISKPIGACIGSDCMMWRFESMKLGHDLQYMVKTYGKESGEKQWKEFHDKEPSKGYCGLAGKP